MLRADWAFLVGVWQGVRVRWAVEALAVSERSRGQSSDNLMKQLCMVVMLIKKQQPGNSNFPSDGLDPGIKVERKPILLHVVL